MISHNLAFVGKPISVRDLVMYALDGLSCNPNYNPLVTSINMMHEKPNFSSYCTHLKTYERMILQQIGLDKDRVFYAHVTSTNFSFPR